MIRRLIFRKKGKNEGVEVHVLSNARMYTTPTIGDYQKLVGMIKEAFPDAKVDDGNLFLGIVREVQYDKALVPGPMSNKMHIIVWKVASSEVPEQNQPWDEIVEGAPWYKWDLTS